MSKATRIMVIGAGGWGTALAIAAYRAGSDVWLWTRNSHVYETLMTKRVNELYLPDVFVDPDIFITQDIETVRNTDFVILTVPAQKLRQIVIRLADLLPSEVPLVIACKGIERGSLLMMHEVLEDTMPKNPTLILSGPNFAGEVAKGFPAATTVACRNEAIANQFIYAIGGKCFRPYYTDDIVSAQIGGAVKNVIAIACGIAIGKGYGENARSGLITRGLAEMMRLSEALGGRRESLMGLAGLGDLVLTCSSMQSRNFSHGYQLAKGDRKLRNASGQPLLTEGVMTAESVNLLAEQYNVAMPLCQAIYQIIYQNSDVAETIESLLNRPFVQDVERSSIMR